MNFARSLFALAAGACLAVGATVQAYVLQPTTEAGSKDAKIYDSLPTGNFQSNLDVTSPDIGAHFLSLVQFDLGLVDIPAAQVTGAYFTLYCRGLGASGGSSTGGTITISPINDEWRETANDPGAAPLATYDAFFGAAPTLTFGSVVASQLVNGVGYVTFDVTSLVREWMSGARANHGFFIQTAGSDADIGFADVDSNGAAFAPSLTIVPEPGSVVLVSLGALAGIAALRRRRDAA